MPVLGVAHPTLYSSVSAISTTRTTSIDKKNGTSGVFKKK